MLIINTKRMSFNLNCPFSAMQHTTVLFYRFVKDATTEDWPVGCQYRLGIESCTPDSCQHQDDVVCQPLVQATTLLFSTTAKTFSFCVSLVFPGAAKTAVRCRKSQCFDYKRCNCIHIWKQKILLAVNYIWRHAVPVLVKSSYFCQLWSNRETVRKTKYVIITEKWQFLDGQILFWKSD